MTLMALLFGVPSAAAGAFIFSGCSSPKQRAIILSRTLSASVVDSVGVGVGGGAGNNDDDPATPEASPPPGAGAGAGAPFDPEPFLPLLGEGLDRISIAMHRATSDEVFMATPSLQRLRRQVQQLTDVGPSSLGDHAGLGLFAKKNIKAGTIVGLYPAHSLGFELVGEGGGGGVSMFLEENEEDEKYFSDRPHHNSPYLHATDQPLFRRPSLISSLFDEEGGKGDGDDAQAAPPMYLDVNPNRNGELDDIWTSHYINDGASLLDAQTSSSGASSMEEGIEQYYTQSTGAKNCIHIPFGPSPILATVTTKKVKKGEELFTSYGVVYWLGAVETPPAGATQGTTEGIQAQIVQSARDLQKAMEESKRGYATEMADLETALGDIQID